MPVGNLVNQIWVNDIVAYVGTSEDPIGSYAAKLIIDAGDVRKIPPASPQ